MDSGLINSILERKTAIYCYCFLDREKQKRLFSTLDSIAPKGSKDFLNTRDLFYTYCNERNVWYGSDTKPKHIDNIGVYVQD